MCEDWMVECPLCSVCLNIAVVLSFLLICWCAADGTEYNGVLSPQKIVALPVVFFFLLYACYMTECYFASSRKVLSKVLRQENIYQLIERLRNTSPEIHFKAECWHNEPRIRKVPIVDRRGKTRMQNEAYREKVITSIDIEKLRCLPNSTYNVFWSADENPSRITRLNFASVNQLTDTNVLTLVSSSLRSPTTNPKFIPSFEKWKDITDVPEDIDLYSLAVITFTKSYQFSDIASKTLFTNLSCGFQARNRHRDKHMEYEETVTLEGFSDHVIGYVDFARKELWLNIWIYWLFSVFLMSWLYRWMLTRRTLMKEINIVKEIQIVL